MPEHDASQAWRVGQGEAFWMISRCTRERPVKYSGSVAWRESIVRRLDAVRGKQALLAQETNGGGHMARFEFLAERSLAMNMQRQHTLGHRIKMYQRFSQNLVGLR